jgi:heme/copper-type cytochrome/quinol oxidase subunit 3
MTPPALKSPVLDATPVVDELLADIGRIPPTIPPERGDDGGRLTGEPERTPLVSNAVLGMLAFLWAEAMFFAGLVAAFLYLRLGAPVWPPPLQPRLPVEATAVNTVILLLSGLTLAQALRAIRRGSRAGLVKGLGQTALLGAIFLGVQGYEWARLVNFGLKLSSGTYGATFYTLIGTHAAHVFAALVWLSVILIAASRGSFTARAHVPVLACGMYWYFVIFLWPILYVLVYLR